MASVKQLSLTIKNLQNLLPVYFTFLKREGFFLIVLLKELLSYLYLSFILSFFLR